jgi:hypothetical protein
MIKTSLLKIGYTLAITSSVLFINAAQADILTIDSFTQSQKITDRGDTASNSQNLQSAIAGSDIENTSRLLIAEASFGKAAYKTTVETKEGSLKISNNPDSAVLAAVKWSFQPINFKDYGDTLALEVKDIDLNVGIEVIINDLYSSGIKSFSGAGSFEVGFSEFLQPSLFNSVSSLRFNFTGPASWDGQFGPLKVINRSTPEIGSVPLPPAYILMASSLFGLVSISRSKKS